MCNCAKVDAFAGDCCSHKKFDPTKPVQTRDGRKARIICTDAKIYASRPIIYLIENESGEVWNTCDKDGKAGYRENDLVNVPEHVVRYVNIYGPNGMVGSIGKKPSVFKHTSPVDGGPPRTLKLTFEDGVLISSEVVN